MRRCCASMAPLKQVGIARLESSDWIDMRALAREHPHIHT